MSLKIYNGGVWMARLRPLAVPLLVASNLFFAWAAIVRDTVKVVPTTYIIGPDGKVITSVCDPASRLNNQNVAYDLMENLSKTIWEYERGGVQAYSARYVAFKNLIETRSAAEKTIRDMVTMNLGDVQAKSGPIFGESSKFEIDRSMYVVTKKTDSSWEIGVQGTQTITSDKGPTSFRVLFKTIIVEGDAHALYRVSAMQLVSKTQLN